MLLLPWSLGTALFHSCFRTKPLTVLTRMCFVLFQVNLLTGSRFFGKAILGLIQAFSFNWLYFEIGTGSSCPTPSSSKLIVFLQTHGIYTLMQSAGTTCLVNPRPVVVD